MKISFSFRNLYFVFALLHVLVVIFFLLFLHYFALIIPAYFGLLCFQISRKISSEPQAISSSIKIFIVQFVVLGAILIPISFLLSLQEEAVRQGVIWAVLFSDLGLYYLILPVTVPLLALLIFSFFKLKNYIPSNTVNIPIAQTRKPEIRVSAPKKALMFSSLLIALVLIGLFILNALKFSNDNSEFKVINSHLTGGNRQDINGEIRVDYAIEIPGYLEEKPLAFEQSSFEVRYKPRSFASGPIESIIVNNPHDLNALGSELKCTSPATNLELRTSNGIEIACSFEKDERVQITWASKDKQNLAVFVYFDIKKENYNKALQQIEKVIGDFKITNVKIDKSTN